jgi:hypothetical protein
MDVLDIVIEKPVEVSQDDRFFHDYIKHTHRHD